MTRVERLTAMRQGRAAGEAGRALTACPYNANGNDTQRALAGAWTREYLDAHPTARDRVNYGG